MSFRTQIHKTIYEALIYEWIHVYLLYRVPGVEILNYPPGKCKKSMYLAVIPEKILRLKINEFAEIYVASIALKKLLFLICIPCVFTFNKIILLFLTLLLLTVTYYISIVFPTCVCVVIATVLGVIYFWINASSRQTTWKLFW